MASVADGRTLKAERYFSVLFGSAVGTSSLPKPKHVGQVKATPTGDRPKPLQASQSFSVATFEMSASATVGDHILPLQSGHVILPLVRAQAQSTSLWTPLPRHSRHITMPPPFSYWPFPSHRLHGTSILPSPPHFGHVIWPVPLHLAHFATASRPSASASAWASCVFDIPLPMNRRPAPRRS